MNRRMVVGAAAGAAALALVAVGGTYSVPTQHIDVTPNLARTGVLQLDLTAGGSGDAILSFAGLLPGATSEQLIWLASNDHVSATPATLTLTFDQLSDVPGPCATSLDKAHAEIAAGVGGCVIDGATVTGTPARGNLSRLLTLDVAYAPATETSGSCADTEPDVEVLPSTGPGNVWASASAHGGTGSPVRLQAAGGGDLIVAPGHGVCLAVRARWTPSDTSQATPDHPADNAAQGDSFSVRAVFDLEQVHS